MQRPRMPLGRHILVCGVMLHLKRLGIFGILDSCSDSRLKPVSIASRPGFKRESQQL